ncbi:MAG: OmpA family protein [bacterium]|nr:OmpA family protein [bacterium]
MVTGLAVALLAFVGFLLFQHLKRLEWQLTRLQNDVQESREKVREAAEASQAALARAARSEENARLAAVGRTQAEEARAEAAREAEQARQEANTATQQAQLAREETERIRRQREAEVERLQQALGKIAETQRTALGLVMTLGSESVKFDFDKATLQPENRELLSRIAGVLLTAYGFRIQVFGHTDDIGSDEYNQGLSERRAQAVRDYLVAAGVAPELITTRGFGKSSPRVPGTDPNARAKNRRVEIGIIDSVIGYQGEAAQKTRHQ